jgi:hypothetical protein
MRLELSAAGGDDAVGVAGHTIEGAIATSVTY